MPHTPQPAPKGRAGDPGSAALGSPAASEAQPTPHNNLPLRLSGLVGRGREITEVRGLLADNRLLTLTGAGGSGKTRLALAVAQEVVGDYEEGAWLVELAPLSDPDLVVQAVASTLGVREVPGESLVETLSGYLRSRHLLLVLDNCEHLVEACASLAGALLGRCPNLSILATSREALMVEGETLFVVPPLSLPDPRRLPALESLKEYEAARLFVERARAVRPGFVLTEENAMAVAQVCHRLDGMPLAIELAAARTRVLSVGQISSRLDDSFRLLTGGGRSALARQRTLRATMDWSYALLSKQEQALLGRLSVFAGGFTLEAAEAVCAGGGIKEPQVLDLLSSLVDKSLVLAEGHEGEEARYRLLETVRQYASEKLEESGDAERTRRRHAGYYLALAERAEPELKGWGQVAWLARLEGEHDNLRSAMRWLLGEGEAGTAVRLAWALWLFWYLHGHQREGGRYVQEALASGAALPVDLRAKTAYLRALGSYGLDPAVTARLFEESADLFRQTADKASMALAVGGVGLMVLQQGETERASGLLEEALGLYREVGSKWGAGSILTYLGMVPLGRGDYARATRYFEEALALSREVGDRLVGSISLHNLALSWRLQGDVERATRLYVEALELAVEVGDEADVAYCLEGLAALVAEGGEPERAARLFGASEAILEAIGTPFYVHAQDRAFYERAVETLRSRMDEEAFEAAWSEGRTMGTQEAVHYALEATPTQEQAPSQPSYPAGLSPREIEVLSLVARGMTDPQIARELFISRRTVNAHLRSVYRKTGSNTRSEATRFALERGLL